jgi:hypothetical protein
MKKIQLIVILLLFVGSCKQNENNDIQKNQEKINTKNKWAYNVDNDKFTIFPDKFLGINFCKIELSEIIKKFQKEKIYFTCYDIDTGDLFRFTNLEDDINKIGYIKTTFFIGTDLDKTQIASVTYADMDNEGWLHFTIKFKIAYYDELLEILGKKLGIENVNYNRQNYGETSWNANPNHSSPTCISSVTISKRLRYDDVEKAVGYLQIETRPRKTNIP